MTAWGVGRLPGECGVCQWNWCLRRGLRRHRKKWKGNSMLKVSAADDLRAHPHAHLVWAAEAENAVPEVRCGLPACLTCQSALVQ